MGAASGRPMSISLAQGLSPNGWRKILDRIDRALLDFRLAWKLADRA